MTLRSIKFIFFFCLAGNFANAHFYDSFLNYGDSIELDSMRIRDEWRYCGDPFLMDLACVENLNDSVLTIPIINEARKYYGLKDIEGSTHEQKVLEFFRSMGNYTVKEDEVSWCSVFIGSCAKNVGLQYSKLATARSWLNIGLPITEPKPGDIVIFWREDPKSWKGHVSIYLGKNTFTNEVYALGGNQNDEVCILTYNAETILGYRRLNAKLK